MNPKYHLSKQTNMNKILGKISRMTTSGNMTLVDVAVKQANMTTIIIGKPGQISYLQMGKNIELLINESEVSIAKNRCEEISLNNQLDCLVDDITCGEIFSKISLTMEGQKLSSLITSRSVKRLDLKKGDKVTALIKTNEVFLKEPD